MPERLDLFGVLVSVSFDNTSCQLSPTRNAVSRDESRRPRVEVVKTNTVAGCSEIAPASSPGRAGLLETYLLCDREQRTCGCR